MYYMILMLFVNAHAWTVDELTLPKGATKISSAASMPKSVKNNVKAARAFTPPKRFDERLSINTPQYSYSRYISSDKWRKNSILPLCKKSLAKLGFEYIKKTTTKNSETIIATHSVTKELVHISSVSHRNGKRLLQITDKDGNLLPQQNYQSIVRLFS